MIAMSVIACVLAAVRLAAQGMGTSVPMVLRSQAGSVVAEAWTQLADSLHRPGDIWVSVEGGTAKRIIENAWLEFLGRHGFRPQLDRNKERGGEGILITVLDQSVRYKRLENGEYLREIRTALETRRIAVTDEILRYAGPFQRRTVDTVAVRDDGGLAELRNEEERSFVDRIVGPVLLIGGAFLIVYLFFTVRN